MRKTSRTCIAICKNRRGKLMMAGDRLCSYDWGHAVYADRPKIAKKNNILIGASGDSGLCTLLIDIMVLPESSVKDPDKYMFFIFREALVKLLKSSGYIDEDKLLRIPGDTSCNALVGIHGKVYTIDIHNSNPDHPAKQIGDIVIDPAPVLSAIGCGSIPALASLIKDKKALGYNTKEHLEEAVLLACEMSPGCGLPLNTKPDILIED
jgi:hypothetical protein